MYGSFAGHPLLEFAVLVLSGVLGFAFANDPSGPFARQSAITRFVIMLMVGTLSHTFLAAVASFFSLLANGASTSAAILQTLAGLALTAGLAVAFLVMRGDLKVALPGQGPTAATPLGASGPWVPPPGAIYRCRSCQEPLREDASFCNGCGTPVVPVG